jgi:anti-sigma B factor antagonist
MSIFYITDDTAPAGADDGDEVVVLVAAGEVDFAAAPQLRERICEQIDAGRRRLVLDVSTVTFIDSTAIGVLVGAITRLADAGDGSLTIVCGEENRPVMRIFDISGLTGLVEVHRTREEALSALVTAG